MLPLRALILDYGCVLVGPQRPELVQRMAELAGVPLPAFTAAYWAHRKQCDLDGNERRYWDAVLRDAGSALDGAAREAARPGLAALDGESWSQYREEVWEMARQFRQAGGRTALLSNCGPEVMDWLRAHRPVDRYFDVMMPSWEVGLLKPDPAIYRLVLDRLGIEARAALFVDDIPENVASAEAIGLPAFRFEGEQSIPLLRDRIAARTGPGMSRAGRGV